VDRIARGPEPLEGGGGHDDDVEPEVLHEPPHPRSPERRQGGADGAPHRSGPGEVRVGRRLAGEGREAFAHEPPHAPSPGDARLPGGDGGDALVEEVDLEDRCALLHDLLSEEERPRGGAEAVAEERGGGGVLYLEEPAQQGVEEADRAGKKSSGEAGRSRGPHHRRLFRLPTGKPLR